MNFLTRCFNPHQSGVCSIKFNGFVITAALKFASEFFLPSAWAGVANFGSLVVSHKCRALDRSAIAPL